MSINRSKMKRQMYQAGGLGSIPRRKFGFGDFVGDIVETVTKPVKKIAQKIVPKEIAGPLMMAAPFLGPVYGPLAYAAGSAKRTGRIDPVKLALIAAPYVQFQGGEGIGAFKPVGYGGSKYGAFGGETIGVGDMEGVSAAEKASELFEKDFEFLGKGDETASIKDVLGDVVTSPEFIVGGGLSLVQYIEAKKKEKENEGLEFSQEDYDNAVNDYYKQYSESFKKGFKTGGVVSKRKNFKDGMSDNRVSQLLTLREEAMENGDDDKVQEIDQELGLIFKQYKTGGRVGLKDGANDEAIYMTEEGKEVDTGEGKFLTMEEAEKRDPAMFMDTTTYNPIPENAPEMIADDIARIIMGTRSMPLEEGEEDTGTMGSTEFIYNEYVMPKRQELMENFGLSMPEADDLIRKGMDKIRAQKADGGSIKGIGQLAKPKGNKRQGFRGDDAYGGGSVAGGQRSGGERGDGPKTNAPSQDRIAEIRQANIALENLKKDKEEEKLERFRNQNLNNPVNRFLDKAVNFVPGVGMIQKFTGPIQRNRDFFVDKVIGSKNFKGIDFSDLSYKQQEDLYDKYMSARGAGKIDAFGNDISRNDGGNKYIPPVGTQMTMMAETPAEGIAAEDDLYTKYKKSFQRGFAKDGGLKKVPVRTNKIGVKELDYRQDGGFVPLGIKERADDVPAMLSKNEFVFTADAVRGAGNGNINKGARKMYDLMNKLEARKA